MFSNLDEDIPRNISPLLFQKCITILLLILILSIVNYSLVPTFLSGHLKLLQRLNHRHLFMVEGGRGRGHTSPVFLFAFPVNYVGLVIIVLYSVLHLSFIHTNYFYIILYSI